MKLTILAALSATATLILAAPFSPDNKADNPSVTITVAPNAVDEAAAHWTWPCVTVHGAEAANRAADAWPPICTNNNAIANADADVNENPSPVVTGAPDMAAEAAPQWTWPCVTVHGAEAANRAADAWPPICTN